MSCVVVVFHLSGGLLLRESLELEVVVVVVVVVVSCNLLRFAFAFSRAKPGTEDADISKGLCTGKYVPVIDVKHQGGAKERMMLPSEQTFAW